VGVRNSRLPLRVPRRILLEAIVSRKTRGYLSVGRSLVTGAVVGLTQRHPGRLDALDLSAFTLVLDARDPARTSELNGLLAQASIADLQHFMASGRLSSEELTLHLLGRVRDHDAALNSLIAVNSDALVQAREADLRRAAGKSLGALDGIPVTVKDNIETAGPMPTTGGAEILAGHVASADAPVVVALRAAGAVFVGKANLSELSGAVVRTPGFSAVGGQTMNPYGGSFSPGGSSSGSAVSVAAGFAIVSVGTETSGSLIVPAAFNGLVAMKPSRAVVDARGVIPLVRHQDSPGPIGRSVADAAALLAAMAAQPLEVQLAEGALAGVRVGVLAEDIRNQKTPIEDTSDNGEMLARIDAGLRAAAALPVDAVIVSDTPMADYDQGFLDVVLGGVSHDTIGYLAEAGAPVATLADLHAYNLAEPRRRMPAGQFFLDLALGKAVDREPYEEAALRLRGLAEEILDATFDAAGTDVLVSLTNRHSALYATAGYPAVTVPLGLRANGMPTGATLIGRPGADGRLLGYAHAFERASMLRVPADLSSGLGGQGS
jgi:amidase